MQGRQIGRHNGRRVVVCKGMRKSAQERKGFKVFGKGVQLFRLFGFPVRADWSWLIILALVTWSLAVGVFPQTQEGLSQTAYWIMGFIGALGLFASIIIHEFSHSMVARSHGMPMRGITLFIFGGVAELGDEPPNARTEFLVAIAGPAASIVVIFVCMVFRYFGVSAGWPEPVTLVLGWLALINGVLVVFNAIPAFPLDGGRVLRSALWKWKDDLKWATRVCVRIGSGFGTVLIILGIASVFGGSFIGGLWWVLIGLFLRHAAQASYQQLVIRRALEGEPVHRFMESDPLTVSPDLSIRELIDEYVYTHHHKMFPVVEEGRLRGCVTTKDIKQIPKEDWDTTKVGDVADECDGGNTISPSDDVLEAFKKINREGNSRLLVAEDGHLEGILTLKDLMKFISLKVELEEDMPMQGAGMEVSAAYPQAAERS